LTRRSRKLKKGFTLVEVLILTVILLIIAAIVVPRVFEARTRAHYTHSLYLRVTKENQKVIRAISDIQPGSPEAVEKTRAILQGHISWLGEKRKEIEEAPDLLLDVSALKLASSIQTQKIFFAYLLTLTGVEEPTTSETLITAIEETDPQLVYSPGMISAQDCRTLKGKVRKVAAEGVSKQGG